MDYLKKRFEPYSDDTLIDIITKNRASYSDADIEAVKAVLTERGYNINQIEIEDKGLQVDNEEFEEMNEYRIGPDGLTKVQLWEPGSEGFLDNINTSIDQISESEKTITTGLKEQIGEMTNETLIDFFKEKIDKVDNNGEFGDGFELHSIGNVEIIYNHLNQRGLAKQALDTKAVKVIRKMNNAFSKRYARNSTLNFILGISLLLAVVFFVAMGFFRFFLLVFVFFGVQQLSKGGKNLAASRKYALKNKSLKM